MPLNKTPDAIVEYRHVQVARLLVRHYKQREIQEALTNGRNTLNPEGKACSLGTINADVKASRAE